MAWVCDDYECGCYVTSEICGTLPTSSGMTLAQEFPETYFKVPFYVAWLLDFTAWLSGLAKNFALRWKRVED